MIRDITTIAILLAMSCIFGLTSCNYRAVIETTPAASAEEYETGLYEEGAK